jgi:hypothetical protein
VTTTYHPAVGGRDTDRETEGFLRRGKGDAWHLLASPQPWLIVATIGFGLLGVFASVLDRGLVWAVIGIVGPAAVAFALCFIRAPFRQRDEARQRLVELDADEHEPPTLEHLQPIIVNDEWRVRLNVTNTSTRSGAYAVQVVGLSGLPQWSPEPPWWVPWRNMGPERECRLPPGSNELLELARFTHVDTTDRPDEHWRPIVTFPVLIGDKTSDNGVSVEVYSAAQLPHEIGVEIKVWYQDRAIESRLMIRLVDDGHRVEPVLSLARGMTRPTQTDR